MNKRLQEDAGMIVQDYKLAKDPEEQIEIMAQTHGASTAEVRCLLAEHGAYKINGEHIAKALEILQKGGKNHGFANLRSYISAFGQCGAKQAKRIILDYRKQPWDGRPEVAIPDEKFAKVFDEKPIGKAAKPKQEKEKLGFSEEDKNMIAYGLNVLLSERNTLKLRIQAELQEKQKAFEDAKKAYEEAKASADMAAAAVQNVKNLLERIRSEGVTWQD